jgi:hypothetical protein
MRTGIAAHLMQRSIIEKELLIDREVFDWKGQNSLL